MFRKKINLPDTLISGPQTNLNYIRSQYSADLSKRLGQAYNFVGGKQQESLIKDHGTEPMFAVHDFVWPPL